MSIQKKIESYSVYGLLIVIFLLLLHNINKLLLNLISEYNLFIVLEIGIIVVQFDNFSLLYDYKNLKQFYEKIIKDEYRIKKLTIVSNNLVKKYKNIEEKYYKLLKSNNFDKIKLYEMEMHSFRTLYNKVENNIKNIKNNSFSTKSIISSSSSLNSIEYKLNTLQSNSFDSMRTLNKTLKDSSSIGTQSLNFTPLRNQDVIEIDPIKLYIECSINKE